MPLRLRFRSACAFVFLSLFILPTAKAQNLNEPGTYMTYINNHHYEITKDFMSYTSAVAHGKSARKVEKRRQALLQTVTDARRKVTVMPALEGDKSLRDSTARFLMTSFHLLNDDYGKIVNLEEVAEQSYDAMEAYMLAQELASQKLHNAFEALKNTEKSFAEKHRVQLVSTDSELSKTVEKANRVSHYHGKVYLVFFKSYKQEMYLMDALSRKDVNAIEQNRNTLLSYATEGIAKLDTMKTFDGDRSLINACRQLLEFQRAECQDKISVLTGFFLKEENFLKIKKAFDAKRERERTQADIDQYNQAANEMNKAGAEVNTVSKTLNENRNKLIDNWNKASANFMDKHTPKYK